MPSQSDSFRIDTCIVVQMSKGLATIMQAKDERGEG
jgi:hypothetical protein